jgi:hypothetical protein
MFVVNFIQDLAGNLFEICWTCDPAGNEVITINPLPLLEE